MNILIIVKNDKNMEEVNKLKDKGYKVFLSNGIDLPDIDYIDIVISLSEDGIEEAFNISQRYSIPFYAHIDWIPPWVVFKDSEFNWGYFDKIKYEDKMNAVRKFQNKATYWAMADVKSMGAKCFHDIMKEITGIKDLTIYTKHPMPDFKKLKHIEKKKDSKFNITCVGDFLPYNRIHHVLKSLQSIKYDGIINIVGDGPDRKLYDMVKGNINVKYYDNMDKLEVMKNSDIVISLWDTKPLLEACSLGIQCISYDSEYVKEVLGDNVIYAKNNSIRDLSDKILKTINGDIKNNVSEIKDDYMLEKLILKTLKIR